MSVKRNDTNLYPLCNICIPASLTASCHESRHVHGGFKTTIQASNSGRITASYWLLPALLNPLSSTPNKLSLLYSKQGTVSE